jgi:hypothetical protein
MSNANASSFPWTEVLLGSQTADRIAAVCDAAKRVLRGSPEPDGTGQPADEDWRLIQAQRFP